MQVSRVTISAAAVMLALAALPAFAQGGRAIWSFEHYDTGDNGQTLYVLSYGVPETDAVAFTATCHSGMQGPSMPVMLSVDYGDAPDGAPMVAHFRSGSFDATYAAAVSSQSSESAGLVAQVGTNDPLWHVLSHNGSITFAAADRQPVTVPLQGSAQPVEDFLQTCRSVFAETDAATPSPSALMTSQYVCDDGTRFRAQFDNSRAYSIAILSFSDGPEVPLIQAVSGSGVRYANGDDTLSTEGDTAVLSRIGKPDVNCRATGSQ